jgi:3-hydroxybutyryl-CoA dehydrogenase
VIETIVEDMQAKSELYRLIGPWLRPEAMLATNTSSFLIGSLATSVVDPSRFAGLHFLNPAHETAVVEVIRGPATADDIALALADLGRRMGKTPLLVMRDIEGFIWNRIQHAVLRECLHLLDQGIADIASIDAAVSDGLAPRWVAAGPFATADLGNIETWRIVASQLFPVLSSSSEVQASLVDRAAGRRGFYRWKEESRRDLAALRGEIVRALEPTIERRRRAMPAADDGADR